MYVCGLLFHIFSSFSQTLSNRCAQQKQVMQMHYHLAQTFAKKGAWPLRTAHIKQWLIGTTVVQFTQLLSNLVNLRNPSGIWIKLKETIFKNKNQTNSTITARIWVLSTEWSRTWPSTGLVSKRKNGGGPLLFEWQVLFFRVCGY